MKVVVDNNLKPFVNNPQIYDAFCIEIQRRIDVNKNFMASSKEVDAMMRYQGRIHALQELLRLREEVNG